MSLTLSVCGSVESLLLYIFFKGMLLKQHTAIYPIHTIWTVSALKTTGNATLSSKTEIVTLVNAQCQNSN